MTAAGIDDVDALLSAHRETLLAEGATIRLVVSTSAPDGSVSQRSTQAVELAPNATTVLSNGSGLGPDGPQQVDAWLNETTSLFRFRGNGSTEYRILPASPGRPDLALAGNVGRYLRAAPDAFSVVTVADGLATLRAETNLSAGVPGPETTMRLRVDSRGVVRSFALNQTQSQGERYHVDFAVESTGVTPTRPAWVDAIPSGAFLETNLDIEVENGTAVSITNEGPDAVPAGSTVTLVADGVTYDATLETPVDAGDRRWLWVASDTETLTVGTETPTPDSARSLGGRATVVVRTDDGIRLASADLAWRTDRGR